MARNGWCTHPGRQHTSDAKILVRGGELACRNSWGGDLFQSRKEEQAAQAEGNTDLPGSLPEPEAERDDEVTSIFVPPTHSPPPASGEDRLVSDRPAPQRDASRHLDDDDTRNDAARHDQDERARIMARGSSDAIKFARERHLKRRSRFAGEPVNDAHSGKASNDRIVTQQIRFSDRFITPSRHAASHAVDNSPVPKTEVEGRNLNGLSSDRFDTVPEIDPAFNLTSGRHQEVEATEESEPLLESSEPERVLGPSIPEVHAGDITSYERVLQRARRIREAKQQGHRPIRHVQLSQPTSASESDTHTARPSDEQTLSTEDADVDEETPEFSETWHSFESSDDVADDIELDEFDRDQDQQESGRSRRSGGWFSHLGFTRRTSRHDDATVARHQPEYAYEDEQDHDELMLASLYDGMHEDERQTDEACQLATYSEHDLQEEHVSRPEEHQGDFDRPAKTYVADLTAVARNEADDRLDGRVNTTTYVPRKSSVDDSSPAIGFEQRDEHLVDEIVPDTGEGDSQGEIEGSSWHRVREAPQLPDLDDNLFGDRFERLGTTLVAETHVSEETLHAPDTPLYSAVQSLASRSPRDSFLRARRFRDWEIKKPAPVPVAESHLGAATRSRPEKQDVHDAPPRLPDLDEQEFDVNEVASRSNQLLDMTIEIAPEVPRECRSCRSFRSAEGGARGWCNNEWAFTHRRMVNEDDLACETTIGCWWLPSDRYWLIEDDNGYASPTPRMDELIARYDTPPSRKVSGD